MSLHNLTECQILNCFQVRARKFKERELSVFEIAAARLWSNRKLVISLQRINMVNTLMLGLVNIGPNIALWRMVGIVFAYARLVGLRTLDQLWTNRLKYGWTKWSPSNVTCQRWANNSAYMIPMLAQNTVAFLGLRIPLIWRSCLK